MNVVLVENALRNVGQLDCVKFVPNPPSKGFGRVVMVDSGIGAEAVEEGNDALVELEIAVAVASKLSRRVVLLVCFPLPPDVVLSELKRSCRFSILA